MKIKIRVCPIADKDHKISKRNYAHVFHHKNTICIAEEFKVLPIEYWSGIIAHEIGHILIGTKGSNKLEDIECEIAADRAFSKKSGIKILYKDSTYGKSLQCIDKKDIIKFDKFLDSYDFEYGY